AVYPGQCAVSVEHDQGVMEAGLFRFLRFSLGLEGEVKGLLDGRKGTFDWDACYQFAKRQTLVGVLFDGIQRLPKELAPARPLLLRWLSDSESIRRRNMRIDRASAYIYNKVCAAGFRCCILKGQGNALLYPHPSSRTPGDVDVWVMANREELRHIALSLTEGDGSSLQESLNHIGLTVHGVSMELHSTPALLNSPLHNSRLQKWLKRNADLQCSNRIALPNNAGEVAVPTLSFNIIYQLCHLFHHCFYEGVGLRQIVDYYFVLMNTDFSGNTDEASGNTDGVSGNTDEGCLFLNTDFTDFTDKVSGNTDEDGVLSNTDFTDNTDRIGGNAESDGSLMNTDCTDLTDEFSGNTDRGCFLLNTDCTDFTDSSSGGVVEVDSGGSLVALQEELKWLGLWEFAGAVMCVLREVMGLDEKRMICAPDERRGRLLLEEIMAGGNFGHYDERNHFGQGALWHNIQRFRRDWRMLRFYPSEALSEPLFRAWHFLWRWKQKHIGMPKERNLN
ncbi:MAG: nucleotidyltransferase family protein, partial [Bacteroidaceae bacterium]|nr:nucleotidyltransferase family protein [Bacteroidaceae bacterium]